MCRLLCVSGRDPFELGPHLERLSAIAQASAEYQGHGWGCSWLNGGSWQHYHDIRPIWEDARRDFGHSTLLLAHARSAFKDEGIAVENNMPFADERFAFVFNGELRGVRIREEGRIGAEKLFNYIKRFDKGDTLEALSRAVGVIKKKTRYIRAMNLVLASARQVYTASVFNESPEYFQMWHRREERLHIICSAPYPNERGWRALDNDSILSFAVGGSSACTS